MTKLINKIKGLKLLLILNNYENGKPLSATTKRENKKNKKVDY